MTSTISSSTILSRLSLPAASMSSTHRGTITRLLPDILPDPYLSSVVDVLDTISDLINDEVHIIRDTIYFIFSKQLHRLDSYRQDIIASFTPLSTPFLAEHDSCILTYFNILHNVSIRIISHLSSVPSLIDVSTSTPAQQHAISIIILVLTLVNHSESIHVINDFYNYFVNRKATSTDINSNRDSRIVNNSVDNLESIDLATADEHLHNEREQPKIKPLTVRDITATIDPIIHRCEKANIDTKTRHHIIGLLTLGHAFIKSLLFAERWTSDAECINAAAVSYDCPHSPKCPLTHNGSSFTYPFAIAASVYIHNAMTSDTFDTSRWNAFVGRHGRIMVLLGGYLQRYTKMNIFYAIGTIQSLMYCDGYLRLIGNENRYVSEMGNTVKASEIIANNGAVTVVVKDRSRLNVGRRVIVLECRQNESVNDVNMNDKGGKGDVMYVVYDMYGPRRFNIRSIMYDAASVSKFIESINGDDGVCMRGESMTKTEKGAVMESMTKTEKGAVMSNVNENVDKLGNELVIPKDMEMKMKNGLKYFAIAMTGVMLLLMLMIAILHNASKIGGKAKNVERFSTLNMDQYAMNVKGDRKVRRKGLRMVKGV